MTEIKQPTETRLLKEWVKYQLRIRGLSFAALAKLHGDVHRYDPAKCFNMSFPKWERIIAAAIDMKPEDLWPERYEARAKQKSQRTFCKGKSTRKSEVVQ